jgi:electron transport complex protein RnfE
MKYTHLLKRGLIDENPVFVQLIALCPLLAVTTTALNAVIMGLSTTAVMLCACSVISLLRGFIPPTVRIASYVLITAGFVTALQLVLEAFAPPRVYEELGIYIPLIVVNCILFARIESFASKNKTLPSFIDALGMGLGFTLGLTTVGVIREFLGSGAVFGLEIIRSEGSHILIMVMAPGAFFTLGTIIMVRKYIKVKRGEKRP